MMMLRTHSHPDSSHLVEVAGKKLVLFHCKSCGREFARDPADSEWRAAYVGPFNVTLLAEAISQQWVSEPCPGVPDTLAKDLPEVTQEAVEPVRLQAPPARRPRPAVQPEKSPEIAPAIGPAEETVKARPNRVGRPSKIRFLPTFVK
jgi:hypothetical protein